MLLSSLTENRIVSRQALINANVSASNGYDWTSINQASTNNKYCMPAKCVNGKFSFNDYTYASGDSNRLLPAKCYVCLNPKLLFSSSNTQFVLGTGSQITIDQDVTASDQIRIMITGQILFTDNTTVNFTGNSNNIVASSGNVTSSISFSANSTTYSSTVSTTKSIAAIKFTSVSCVSTVLTTARMTVTSANFSIVAYRNGTQANTYTSNASVGSWIYLENNAVTSQNILTTNTAGKGNYNFEIVFNTVIINASIKCSSPMVVNQLPQYVQANWTFDRFNGGNYNYSPTNYSGESVRPTGNVVVLFTQDVGEAYIYPKSEYFPMLILGHTYYIRWMSRKEQITNAAGTNTGQQNTGVSEDLYWPEMENAIIRGLNNSHYTSWRLNGLTFTAQQSQWPNNTVTNGNYKIRFDCNNNHKYVKYWCTADFMLIDLTACYTNNGYTVPSLSELNAKPYFYGSLPIESW